MARRALCTLSLFAALVAAASLAPSTATAQRRFAPRLRAGISGVGGGFVGEVHGGIGGLSPRIGVQLGDSFAVLLHAQGLVGRFVPAPDDAIAGFAFHTAMFELTVGDVFTFGAGPSLDFVWGCSESRGQLACARSVAYPGADFRAAIVVGSRYDRGARDGVSFSIDVHPTLLDDGRWSTVLLLGIGVERF